MKVALLTNFIPPYRLSLYQEVEQLVEHFQVYVSTEMEHNRNWKVNHGQLNVIVQQSFSYSKKWKNELGFTEKTSVQLPWDTFGKLRKYQPDVVISGEMGLRSFLAALYCFWSKKPLILWLTLSEYTETNKKGVRLMLRKFLIKKAQAILCNGESGKRYLQQLNNKAPVFYVPYTSDYEISAKSSFHEPKKVLLSGQLIERKGIAETVEAIQKLLVDHEKLSFELIVAGSGPLEQLFQPLKSHSRLTLRLLGALKYEDLKEVYNECDLFLFPTLADEWGVVVNEALSSGLPILGSKYSQAVEELIEENKNGWIFDPKDVKEFSNKFAQALSTDSKELLLLSQQANESVRHITPKKVAKNIHKALCFVFPSNDC